jgi:hypothetical protein
MAYGVGDIIGTGGGLMWVKRRDEKKGTYTLILVERSQRTLVAIERPRRYPIAEIDDPAKSWPIETQLQPPLTKSQLKRKKRSDP